MMPAVIGISQAFKFVEFVMDVFVFSESILSQHLIGSTLSQHVSDSTFDLVALTTLGVFSDSLKAFQVRILDENDNSPKFSHLFRAEIEENSAIGAFVTQVFYRSLMTVYLSSLITKR